MAQGQVQGVGFRPFLWRLARTLDLTGFCRNTSAGVETEIQGSGAQIAEFERRLASDLPPLARIVASRRSFIPPAPEETRFEICESQTGTSQNILVSPDITVCENCLADIRAAGNRRSGYAFTNCTDCGPRFSITRSLPYDRSQTAMACFELCPACAEEYHNPADRRFHAQPVACAQCGPQIWFVRKGEASLPNSENTRNVIEKAGEALLAGKILALRGLGGFQLACNAMDRGAVQRLRDAKGRPHKALALMSADLAGARELAEIDRETEALLTGRQKPIVLCQLRPDAAPRAWICPDTSDIGIMLPYTPLHALLLDWLAARGCRHLVVTSGNRKGEPICLGNREALAKLANLADAWLLHNRDILCRVDDSVIGLDAEGPLVFRRARGYVPEPLALAGSGKPVLGCGAQLKATFCIGRGSHAFLSQHIGDLEHPGCADFYEEAYAHLAGLLEASPALIVRDLHPDFFSSKFGEDRGRALNVPVIGLQHHAAHAAACLAENGIYEPCLALCLDGTGLGPDNTIWGGELLEINLAEPAWRRRGSLVPFRLPGGEKAIREPWRIATALRWQLGETDFSGRDQALVRMLEKRLNSPVTTSAGRLFDAVAAQLGLCDAITYEGQAAIRLESSARKAASLPADFAQAPLKMQDDLEALDGAQIFGIVTSAFREGASAPEAAYLFHDLLAFGFAELAARVARKVGIRRVGLTGGVFCNRLFRSLILRRLKERELEPVLHRETSPGDGGIAFGQVVWGRQMLNSGKLPG